MTKNLLLCRGLLLIFIAKSALTFSLSAADWVISWEGTISSVTTFDQKSASLGLAVGSPIRGSARFNVNQSIRARPILGSHTYSTAYRYGNALTQTVSAAENTWRVEGGDLILTNSTSGDYEAMEFYSRSDNSRAELFPNPVGPFELGFALFDRHRPLGLFNGEIPELILDLTQATSASGFLTTRKWDGTGAGIGEIVAGYYFTFDISKATLAEVSERPSHYSVRAKAAPSRKGRVRGAGRYSRGIRVTVKAIPKKGARFSYWTENGKRLSRRSTYSFTSDRPRTLIARFR